jgi:hypothetical protein
MSKSDLQIIDAAFAIKRAFGDFKILNEFEELDIPEVIRFAKIVSNYLAMVDELNKSNKSNK